MAESSYLELATTQTGDTDCCRPEVFELYRSALLNANPAYVRPIATQAAEAIAEAVAPVDAPRTRKRYWGRRIAAVGLALFLEYLVIQWESFISAVGVPAMFGAWIAIRYCWVAKTAWSSGEGRGGK